MPNISLIITTFNRAALLTETVLSARRAGTDLEIILVDDASSDGTEQMCRQMKGIRYIRLDSNRGVAHARNVGIRESSADYVAFLDDDDLRLPGSLDRQLDRLKASPRAALVYGQFFHGDTNYCLPNGTLLPPECPTGDVYWDLLEANFVALGTVVARRQWLIDAGLFDTSLDTLEDYEFWVRIAEHHHFAVLEEPVAIIRMRSETSGQKTSDRAHHDRRHKEIHRRLLRSPRALAVPRRELRRNHRRHMTIVYNSIIHDSAIALINGNPAAAKSYLRTAMRMKPFHPKAYVSLLWVLASKTRQGQG